VGGSATGGQRVVDGAGGISLLGGGGGGHQVIVGGEGGRRVAAGGGGGHRKEDDGGGARQLGMRRTKADGGHVLGRPYKLCMKKIKQYILSFTTM
jgi:hypothetical protein